ncbi:membrane protein insertion efficiency factor YidD [Nesterenkonia suensis]
MRRQHWGPLRGFAALLLATLLKAYRKVISPLYGQVCSYYPSCSAYGLEAVTVHGALRGSLLTGWRILRCNPFTGGGVDHVPVGRRIWPEGSAPSIIETNHPPIPLDHDCAHDDDGRPPNDAEAPATLGGSARPADTEQR